MIFPTLEKGDSPQEEDRRWDLLVDFYRKLVGQAEQCGVKVAAHTVARPERFILWDYGALCRLFEQVPSPYNGVCLCIGNFWLSEGEEMYDVIRRLGDRLFFVHLRSTKRGLGETPFWFDSGGPDYRKIVQALRDIDYAGDMRAEHMPEVIGQNRSDIGTAWVIGYMKAALQFL
jgi:D-mannonate dehydratase